MVTIKPCTVQQVKDSGLTDGYAEYAIEGLPPCQVQWESYELMEATGTIKVFGAFDDFKLIGFVSVIPYRSLHYGQMMLTTESFFVAKQYRSMGAGLKLLREIERYTKEIGAAGLLVTAPYGQELDTVLKGKNYIPTHNVYFKPA